MSCIQDIFNKLIKYIRNKVGLPIEYKYKNFSILLPSDHMLPEYQKKYRLYDKFFPYLATFCNTDDAIVDVGANVGDTLAGCIQKNPYCTYICIEADDLFYNLLNTNVKRIKNAIGTAKIFTCKYLVGQTINNVSLAGKGGTKHAVPGLGCMTSKKLDEIILELPEIKKIRILKSDTDGFDYDVLKSSFETIMKHRPLIFFECFYTNEEQKHVYIEVMKLLEKIGYCRWAIFDNFGELVIITENLQIVFQLIDYVWRQKIDYSPRIYYYDILTIHKDGPLDLDLVISSYYEEVYR